MNFKKILTITIIAIFAVGMIMGAAAAGSHTFKDYNGKKWTVKLTNKEYKKLRGEYKTKKVTKTTYKTKTVTKYQTKHYENTINDFSVYSNGGDNGARQIANLKENFTDKGYKIVESWNVTKNTTYWTANGTRIDIEINETHHKLVINKTWKEPYTVTEKTPAKTSKKVKVYVRKFGKDTLQKTIGYRKVKQSAIGFKTVMKKKTITKWKYCGETYIFGISTPAQDKQKAKIFKKLAKKGWKRASGNDVDPIGKYHMTQLSTDGMLKHYILMKKTVKVPTKVPYEKKVTLKKPVLINFDTDTPQKCVTFKVYCSGKKLGQGFAQLR